MSREIGWEEELAERIRAVFIDEADERLAALVAATRALQDNPPESEAAHHRREAFRQAHTLKGGARAAGFPDVERVADDLEHLFERLRSGEPGGPGTWAAIHAAADAVKALIDGRAADVDAVVAALEESTG